MIKKLDVDRVQQRVLSVSDDKTAKIWDLRSGRLLATLRVPFTDSLNGQLFVGALQPQGDIAAVGGYTDVDGRAAFYFFSVSNGRLVAQLAGRDGDPAWVVHNLRFSLDGRYLAACLGHGARGFYALRIYDLSSDEPTMITEHLDFRAPLHGVDFSTNGDLAVASLDGSLHYYKRASQYREFALIPLTAAAEPMHVRFSPNGSKIVVGYNAAPVFSVVSVNDRRVDDFSKAAELPDQRGLHVVEWSSDGRSIYAGGEPRGNGRSMLYRWSNEGLGPVEQFDVANQQLTDLHRLQDGVVFSTADPQITRLASDGTVVWSREPEIPDHRYDSALFGASEDGGTVQFAYGPRGDKLGSFTVTQPENAALREGAALARVNPAQHTADGWRVENWRDSYSPTINGNPTKLEDLERVVSMSIAPDGRSALLGTRWALRTYDRTGAPIDERRLASAANQVTFSGDGKWVLAALSDGSIRWYRARGLEETLGLLPRADGKEWIAWTPNGLYTSSLHGDELIGWHINTPTDETTGVVGEPDFFKAIQFERELFRVGLARRALFPSGASEPELPPLREILPPRVRVTAAKEDEGSNLSRVVVEAESTGLPIRELAVYLNGVPITPASARNVGQAEAAHLTRELEIPLPLANNDLRVEVFNGRSMGLAERYVPAARDLPPPRGDLYVLSIGVNRFDDEDIQRLNFAVNDAKRFQEYFATLRGTLFSEVHRKLLVDDSPERPTKDKVEEALEFVKAAQANDTVIITLASHGINDGRGNYYFVPIDANVDDADLVEAGSDRVPSFVSWRSFFEALRVTAGRRLLIVDTCESSSMEGSFDVYSLAKRSVASSFALMTAAQGKEKSQEYEPRDAPSRNGQGLFTYAVLEALKTHVDPDSDGATTLSEVFRYAKDFVVQRHDPYFGSQTPYLLDPPPLDDLALARRSSVQ